MAKPNNPVIHHDVRRVPGRAAPRLSLFIEKLQWMIATTPRFNIEPRRSILCTVE